MNDVIYSSVDTEYFDSRNGGTCVLGGWRASETEGMIDLLLLVDGQEQKLDYVKYYERPDVFKVCRTLSKKDRKVAFKAAFHGLDAMFAESRTFQLLARKGESRKVIWEKSSEELRKEYGRQTLLRRIDSIRKKNGAMVISGWVVDRLEDAVITVKDENDQEIPFTLKKRPRVDVCRFYRLQKKEQAWGFEVEVRLEEFSGKQLFIWFRNSVTEKYNRVDRKKFEYENSPKGRRAQLLSWKKRRWNWDYIRKYGISRFVEYIKDYMEGDPDDYDIWRKQHMPDEQALKEQRKVRFAWRPLISIAIPLFNTPRRYLAELLDSICSQTYANWELCLADGSTDDQVQRFIEENYAQEKRIRYQRLEKNLGIAGNTNAAAEMAQGEYVMLCDHDDLVAPDALFEMVSVLNEDPDTDILYTDEDLVNSDSTEFSSPRFKPDFNLDFLRSINYICHIFMVRKSILDETGCLREEYDGAQDYDLILRCCEKTDRIRHIPKVLYHWRAHENSTAGNPESKKYAIDAGKRALEAHYRRMGVDAKVEYTDIFIMFRTIMKVQGMPKVSIIIPNKDHAEDLDKCITSIEKLSTWKNYEIIVVENNSEEEATFRYYDTLQKKYDNVKVVVWEREFNYSAINNFGASFAGGDFYVLMNNDIEVITPDWMEQMLGYCQRPDVGIVGAKLYYPDDTVQHAGAVIGLGGFAGHVLTDMDREATGYFGRLKAIQDISAVTAACLMIRKDCFEQVHGLDEKFRIALNDMDLCLKVREKGYLIVMDPWVEMYHYESKSRGMEDTSEKHERFKREIARFRLKWRKVLEKGDPYYSPNLTLMYGDCSLRRKHEHFDIVEEIERDRKCSRNTSK
jgi:GT2 family glycosyltransferase